MRRTIALLAGAGLLSIAVTPASGTPDREGDGFSKTDRQTMSNGSQVAAKTTPPGAKPSGANPYLALVPDPSKVDFAGWKKYLKAQSKAKAATRDRLQTDVERQSATADPLLVDEDEPAGVRGSNDETATAQSVPQFGTAKGRNPLARIVGTMSPEAVTSEEVPASAEDDGAIPLAAKTGIGTTRDGISTTGTVGDGPHGSGGSGSGDFDFYAVDGIAGEALTVDITTTTGDLDSIVAVFDDTGELIALNDDFDGFDSLLTHVFDADGAYTVMVAGFPSLPDDPTDSASGPGAGTEGPYNLEITMGETDVDVYAMRLREGDVLGASVAGEAAELTIYDPASLNVHGSMQDATFIYPAQSPLPGGGNAVTEHVADETGWHYVAVGQGSGDYDVTVEAYRPGLEKQRPAQTIFLDFDGERVNTAIWGGPGVRTLSPLRAFLGRWGLTNADHDELVDRIVAETRENLRRDMIDSGLNDDFDIRIQNSLDDPDPFGDPNVSRVIVGGTIEQSGLPTIGVAQSIDPGNFGTEESAVVLLDVLSERAGEPGDPSLNTYVTPASDRLAFVGRAVGNVVSHEAGHFFGDWHVDQFNDQANLMDQGGNFALMFAVGPDGIGGTADDPDVDFGEDDFNPNEGFTGVEDTLSRLAFGLTS
ncbi:MAG: hypothetical protein ACRDO1_12550 [Nocardioidaceae bacterium]